MPNKYYNNMHGAKYTAPKPPKDKGPAKDPKFNPKHISQAPTKS